jgi:hypothetical protein
LLLKWTVYPRRNANRNYLIREVPNDDRAGAHDRVGTDADALECNRSKAQMRESS